MLNWLIGVITNHQYTVYAIIFLLGVAEGPTLSLICGVILSLGYVSFWPVYLVLMAGDLVGDTVWYHIGRRYGHRFVRRFDKYFDVSEESIAKVIAIFHKYSDRILLLSKMSNGLGFSLVTLMTAGMVGIPFRRYIMLNAAGQFFWTGLLLFLGYYLGSAYTAVDSIIGKVSIAALFVIVLVALVQYRKYLAKRAKNIQTDTNDKNHAE